MSTIDRHIPSIDAAMSQIIAAEEEHVAHNYHPLPVVDLPR